MRTFADLGGSLYRLNTEKDCVEYETIKGEWHPSVLTPSELNIHVQKNGWKEVEGTAARENVAPKSILHEAERIINGPKRDAYGAASESFNRLAQVLSVVLFRKLKEPLDAHDAAMVGVALKVVREANKPDRENRVDGCGYFALADEVAK